MIDPVSNKENILTPSENSYPLFHPTIVQSKIQFANFEPDLSYLPPPKPSTELLIDLTNLAEQIKSDLLKFDLKQQRDLSDSIIDTQKKFQTLLKEKRIAAASMANIGYFERLISGLFSACSIGAGVAMTASLTPSVVVGGSLLMLSGSLSLTALGLESLGYDNSITRPISLSGLAVGMLATAVGGYLNPHFAKNSLAISLETSQVFFSGVCEIASGSTGKKLHELEGDITHQELNQDLKKQEQEKIAMELSEIIKNLNVAEHASKLLKQQQDLMHLYLNSQMIQG